MTLMYLAKRSWVPILDTLRRKGAFISDENHTHGYSYVGEDNKIIIKAYLNIQKLKIITFDDYNRIIDENKVKSFEDIAISKKSVSHIRNDHHGIPCGFVERIAEYMSNSLMIFDSGTQNNSIVVITEMLTDDGPVIVPIRLDIKLERHKIHRIPSVDAKENFNNALIR